MRTASAIGWCLPLLLACACKTARERDLAAIEGRGLIAYDREAPAGAETFAAPTWTAGDAFVFVKGGRVRLAHHVEVREDGGYDLVEDESGAALRLDREFGELGLRSERHPEFDVALEPVDVRFSWPLWVGKRWSCHFVRRAAASEDAVPLVVKYHCDASETIDTQAGSFRCLRIWRTVQVAFEGNYIDRVQVLWYAPEAATVVRRLDDGVLTELVERHRQ